MDSLSYSSLPVNVFFMSFLRYFADILYLCRRMAMNVYKILIFIACCLLTACQLPKTTPDSPLSESRVGERYSQMVGSDSAAIYQDLAFQEMFNGSIVKAEIYASRAFLLSRDSTLENNALSLLCYIYYREGKQQELELLMQSLSPEMYMNVMSVQWQVEQAKAGRQKFVLTSVIILLLLLLGALGSWYVRKMKALSHLYQQRISSARRELREELERLAEAASPEGDDGESVLQVDISETKTGIDVLFAIINDQNISQMGKREEQAVLKTLPMVDTVLADTLDKAASALTPKETFFCIMEYYGKTDQQKARSFCCSEQAIRSTKSRLGKKMDISMLRSE